MADRKCSKCKRLLPDASFPAHRQCRNGVNPQCRTCVAQRIRQWKQLHSRKLAEARRIAYRDGYRDRHAELQLMRAARDPFRVRSEWMFSGVRDAAKRGVPVGTEISRAFLHNWLSLQHYCVCCGVEFELGKRSGRGPNDAAPSLDRFIPEFGYVLGNLSIICWRCNNIKRNYKAADLRRVADWMEIRGNQTDKFKAAI